MKTKLQFDFTVNEADNSILVVRELAAPLAMVWDAWTKSNLLDKWWAPKPYEAKTKSMDFKEGGSWLYAMVGPENDIHRCRADFNKITTHSSIEWTDAFCHEDWQPNMEQPRSCWTIQFSEVHGITTVSITIRHENADDMAMLIKMGFKEGFTMALGNLDELLTQEHK